MKVPAALLLPALAALVSAPALAAGQVFVVDTLPLPGVDFTNLQDAIDVAAPDDVILIKGGTYANPLPSTGRFEIDGKSATLVAESLSTVLLTSPVQIENLGPNHEVLLRGIDIAAFDSGRALSISNCLGDVWVEDADITSISTLYPFLPTGDGVRVAGSSSVKLVRCTMTGATITTGTNPGFDGLECVNSNVALYDCTLQGGSGGDGSSFYPHLLESLLCC